MKRRNLQGLLTVALLFPLLTGFECQVVVSDPPVLAPGNACDGVLDENDAYCTTADTLVYCDSATQLVLELDCPADGGNCTGSGATAGCTYSDLLLGDPCDSLLDEDLAYCTTEDTLVYCDSVSELVMEIDCFAAGGTCFGEGANAMCDLPWAAGNPCDWTLQADEAVCQDLTSILRCGIADVIELVTCKSVCEDYYGATAVTAAECIEDSELFGYDACECTFGSTCTVEPSCWDSASLMTCDGLISCDQYCVNVEGETKGVCEFGNTKCTCG